MPFNYQNIIEIDTANGQVRGKSYTPQDIDLMNNVYGYLENPKFGESSYDRVELHVYDTNENRLYSNHNIDD